MSTVSIYAKPYELTKGDKKLYVALNDQRPIGGPEMLASDKVLYRDNILKLTNYGSISVTTRKVPGKKYAYKFGFHVKLDKGVTEDKIGEFFDIVYSTNPSKVVVR